MSVNSVTLPSTVCERQGREVSALDGIPNVSSFDAIVRTDALLRGLHLICSMHDASDEILRDLSLQVHGYLDTCSMETVWLARCKHLLTYPLSKYLRNEAPPCPDLCFRPTGKLRGWMKSRLISFSRKNTHLWYSWFQAKRSTLPLSDDIVEGTYEKHFKTLTKEDPGSKETIDQIFSDPTFINVLGDVRNQVLKRYKGLGADHSPSASACFEKTRGEGGQHLELRDRTNLSECFIQSDELYRMDCYPRLYDKGGLCCNAVVETRFINRRNDWNTLNELFRQQDLSEPLNCTIQAVLEPNKVRVISKGESIPYYAMKPLQKAIHGSLRGMDCFRLIGRSFCPTDIIDLQKTAAQSWEWFSIDYSAATDGLSWNYSGRILRYIISSIPEYDQQLALSVLGPHNLYYPTRDGHKAFKGVMRNGQLMGSILSFPILCLANLGVYLAATRDLHVGWTDKDRLGSVLVNGDDMLYAAPRALWSTHVDIAKSVGLEMSVGKAYIHPVYSNINSTSLHCDLRDLRSTPLVINYLNTGLAFDQHKVQVRDDSRLETASCDDRQESSFVGNINLILNGCLPGKRSWMMTWILRQHGQLIKDCCRVGYSGVYRNLFLPESIGGMGVELPDANWRFKILKSDYILFESLISKIHSPYEHQRPCALHEVGVLRATNPSPWVIPKSEKRDGNAYMRDYKKARRDLKSSKLLGRFRREIRSYLTGIIMVDSCRLTLMR